MPEMTKQDPEFEEGVTAVAQGESGQGKGAEPGSRPWFWRQRAENMLLIVGPLVPAIVAVNALWRPGVTTSLTDRQAAAVNAVYEYAGAKPSTVRAVHVRIDDPGIMDRLVAAGPSLAFAVLLGLLAYALWRIEINMSAGGRPYTQKDAAVFRRATRWLWSGWWAVFALEMLGTTWYHYGPSGGWFRAGSHVPLDGLSIIILGLSGMFAVVTRMYTTGARAYRQLEDTV